MLQPLAMYKQSNFTKWLLMHAGDNVNPCWQKGRCDALTHF